MTHTLAESFKTSFHSFDVFDLSKIETCIDSFPAEHGGILKFSIKNKQYSIMFDTEEKMFYSVVIADLNKVKLDSSSWHSIDTGFCHETKEIGLLDFNQTFYWVLSAGRSIKEAVQIGESMLYYLGLTQFSEYLDGLTVPYVC